MWRRMVVLVLLLASCGRAEIDVQSVNPPEATAIHNLQATQKPNANALLLYEHPQTGLYFHYPAAWQVQEQNGQIIVNGDGFRLMIEHETFVPNPAAPSAKEPEADATLVENGPVYLLGDLYPTYLDEAARRLHYTHPDKSTPFTVANMRLSIWLEVEGWPLSTTSQQAVDAVVASLGFEWLTTRPPVAQLDIWEEYTDPETGLQFDYPPDWQVTREPQMIIVTNADAQLLLALSGAPSGLPAGDLRKGDPTHIWLNGTAIPRVHLLYEDQIKAVYYGPPMTPISIGEHTLFISASGTSSTPYEALDLSVDTLHQMDWIVTTLRSFSDIRP